jgi:hypothetical protein
MKKPFGLGEVLTVIYGGIMLSPRGIEGLQEILVFMTGVKKEDLRVMEALKQCGPELQEQFPHLYTPAFQDCVQAFRLSVRSAPSKAPELLKLWLKSVSAAGDIMQVFSTRS